MLIIFICLCYHLLKSNMRGEFMSEFEFPTNIRQIGSIGAGLKIYMEDYVCSYLQQYAANGGYEERLAFLVGRQMVIDNTDVLFISGAVQGRDVVENKGILTFGSMSFDYAKEQIEKYFNSLEIVGWMQSQPGYGTFLNANYSNYHLETFKKHYQVLFIVDPIEKLNSFYFFDKLKNDLTESRGYFIYYEKNTGMHEYMLQNKHDKGKTIVIEESIDESDDNVDSQGMDEINGEPEKRESFDIINTPYFRRLRENTNSHGSKFERISLTDKGKYGQKRIVSLLGTLCAVLVLVCVVMGAGLVTNDGRITSLEGQLIDLNTLYKNLLVQSKQNVQPVFAPDDNIDTAVTESLDLPEAGEEQAQVATQDTGQELETAQAPVTAFNETEPELDIPETYIVQEGDNLNYISIKFYGTRNMIDKIMEVNGIDDPNTIYFGKVLILPRP